MQFHSPDVVELDVFEHQNFRNSHHATKLPQSEAIDEPGRGERYFRETVPFFAPHSRVEKKETGMP